MHFCFVIAILWALKWMNERNAYRVYYFQLKWKKIRTIRTQTDHTHQSFAECAFLNWKEKKKMKNNKKIRIIMIRMCICLVSNVEFEYHKRRLARNINWPAIKFALRHNCVPYGHPGVRMQSRRFFIRFFFSQRIKRKQQPTWNRQQSHAAVSLHTKNEHLFSASLSYSVFTLIAKCFSPQFSFVRMRHCHAVKTILVCVSRCYFVQPPTRINSLETKVSYIITVFFFSFSFLRSCSAHCLVWIKIIVTALSFTTENFRWNKIINHTLLFLI